MPFVQRTIEPKYLSRTSLFVEGKPIVNDFELETVCNNTLANALRQLASLVLVANDIFQELGDELDNIKERSSNLRTRISLVDSKVVAFDPKKVAVPEGDICTFAQLKNHYHRAHEFESNLFNPQTRPKAVKELYEAAAKTPLHLMRQLDRWRRDGHRSSKFFICTPVLGAKRRKIGKKIDMEIETRMPALLEDFRKWTSSEALGDITVSADCVTKIHTNSSHVITAAAAGTTINNSDWVDHNQHTIAERDDDGIDHKLPSPEEQLQVVALKFPSQVVSVNVTGKHFDRMCLMRRSLMHNKDSKDQNADDTLKARGGKKARNRRRNTLIGTDQKEIRDAISEDSNNKAVEPEESQGSTLSSCRSKSSDTLRRKTPITELSTTKKTSHFSSLKQWGKKMIANYTESKENQPESNHYEIVSSKPKKNLSENERSAGKAEKNHEYNEIPVKLRDSSAQSRSRRSGGSKDEPHSSSGNWSASSESGRASIGSEITTQPKSTTSATTSSNSLNLHPPSSVNSSRRRFNFSSATSEGTLTPDIIQDLHEDGETSSVYSCDTEGYYTSFHMDSGLKPLKEEDSPVTPLHSTSTFTSNSAENEYELFGKGSTSTTTSSAGTVCTTLRAADSERSLGPAVPERKSSLSSSCKKLNNKSPESSLERDYEKTGTVKRSPLIHNNHNKSTVVSVDVHKSNNDNGDVSPDSGHNTSSPTQSESINSPSIGEYSEFSESSDMEGTDRIERIRIKTTINSSRIPSMCVITPNQSDDESVKSNQEQNAKKKQLELPLVNPLTLNGGKCNLSTEKDNVQVVNVNPLTGYATISMQTEDDNKIAVRTHRAPSPSGGTVTIKQTTPNKSPNQLQPIFKASLLPLNNILGRLKQNISATKNSDKSKNSTASSGDYVTLSDVKNNNTIQESSDLINKNLKMVLSGKETEYISLNELPQSKICDNINSNASASDSLEKRKKGARVTLDADGKVVYSSDSLRRRKGQHTTFEPGPCIRPMQITSPLASRAVAAVRPVRKDCEDDGPILSPQLGKVVIRATKGNVPEIVRMPKIVTATSVLSKPTSARGAYVNVQGGEERTVSPSATTTTMGQNYYFSMDPLDMWTHHPELGYDGYYERAQTPDIMRGLNTNSLDRKRDYSYQPNYNSLPRRQYQNYDFQDFVEYPPPASRIDHHQHHHQNLGIPVSMPQCPPYQKNNYQEVPYYHQSQHRDSPDGSFRMSPIDPKHLGSFRTSTPTRSNQQNSNNLEARLLSPKKSTMTNEELYSMIHKSKKKMNIQVEDQRPSPSLSPSSTSTAEGSSTSHKYVKPETGYFANKRNPQRLSWSPNNDESHCIEAKLQSQSRQSWACNDVPIPEKKPQVKPTSRLDFKRLLLMHGKPKTTVCTNNKLTAVEQLKLSKQQVQNNQKHEQTILNLSQSPKNLRNHRAFALNAANSPNKTAPKTAPKLLSPRSQWRFVNPRTDILSSTIQEDCHEDESSSSNPSPGNSYVNKKQTPEANSFSDLRQSLVKTLPKSTSPPKLPLLTASQRLNAQRAQFLNSTPISTNANSRFTNTYKFRNDAEKQNDAAADKAGEPPALETAF